MENRLKRTLPSCPKASLRFTATPAYAKIPDEIYPSERMEFDAFEKEMNWKVSGEM